MKDDSTTPLPGHAVEQLARSIGSGRAALVVYHRDAAEVVMLDEDATVVLGRDLDVDIVVEDQSLSRRHARFTAKNRVVLVEDLGSTNGTRKDGQLVEQAELVDGESVVLGAVTVALQVLGAAAQAPLGLDRHDDFIDAVAREVERARWFGRSLAVVQIRLLHRDAHLSRWAPQLRARLRPVDRAAVYSNDAIELLLPEMALDGALEIARLAHRALAQDGVGVACGVAAFPASATSTATLLDASRAAALAASRVEPVCGASDGARPQDGGEDEPVAVSRPMRSVLETAERLARSVIPVLISGETGTGKEVVARALHRKGPRREAPMVCVNCASLPGALLESTLFGHERGAFTGATHAQAGIFEAASSGTVFLDEVGELSPAAQATLLRVLETKRVVRLGSVKEIAVDVRVVVATHRDLEALVREGRFREDLLYRLNGVGLFVPPLRERTADVAPLANRFLGAANRANGRALDGFHAEALALLEAYAWPGNVRELKNAIERAVVIADGGCVMPRDLPERVRATPEPERPPSAASDDAESAEDFRGAMQRFEVSLILTALRESGWNQTEAARRLRLPLRTLVRRIKLLGIRRLAFGASETGD